jgi:hypothetical protein
MHTYKGIFGSLLLCVALTSCGGTAETVSSTTVAPATTTTAPNPEADKATAAKYLLVRSDVPSGWTEGPPSPEDPQADAEADKLNACVGLPPASEIEVANVSGNTFSQGENTISSSVTSMKSADIVRQDLKASTDPKNFPCVANALNELLARELAKAAPGATSSSTVTNLEGVASGDDQFALRVLSTVKVAGRQIPVYTDILGLAADRFAVSVIVTYTGSAPPVDLEKNLLASAAAHVSGASIA